MRIPALGLRRKQWEPLAFASPSMALIAFVIVFPRQSGSRTQRHLLPNRGERLIQFASIELQAQPLPDQRIVISDTFGQMEKRPGRVEENRF